MSAQDSWGVQVPALQGVPDPVTPSLSPKIHAVSAQLKGKLKFSTHFFEIVIH